MKYGYGRVSAKDQSLARQLAALKAYAPDLDDDHIFTDKQSGKNRKLQVQVGHLHSRN